MKIILYIISMLIFALGCYAFSVLEALTITIPFMILVMFGIEREKNND